MRGFLSDCKRVEKKLYKKIEKLRNTIKTYYRIRGGMLR